MSDTTPWPRRERDRVVAMLVGQALDDIEAQNIDIATAFRLVAERAWAEGHRAGQNAGGFSYRHPEPPKATVRTMRILKARGNDHPATH